MVDNSGKKLGSYILSEAKKVAEQENLDLVEVSPGVCKLLDYDKFRYSQKKTKQKRSPDNKIITMGVRIQSNDLEHKIKKIAGWLQKNSKVRVVIQFKGREIIHPDIGMSILKNIALHPVLTNLAILESSPTMAGRDLVMMLKRK